MKSITSLYSAYFSDYYRPLCLYALRILENTEEAEDVVQDVFSSLWEKREAIGQIKSVKSYLYTSVKNNSLQQLQKRKPFSDIEEAQIAVDNSEDEHIKRAELEAKLWELIDELPERQREIFLMAKRDGLQYKEIAEITGLSPKTVDNHVTRALHYLRKRDFKTYLFFFA